MSVTGKSFFRPQGRKSAVGAMAAAFMICLHVGPVEETFGEQNFRVLSEMRILGKIKVVILDLVGQVDFFLEFWREIGF